MKPVERLIVCLLLFAMCLGGSGCNAVFGLEELRLREDHKTVDAESDGGTAEDAAAGDAERRDGSDASDDVILDGREVGPSDVEGDVPPTDGPRDATDARDAAPDGEGGPLDQLESITVAPLSDSIIKGAVRQFQATGTSTNKLTKDLTADVVWLSQNQTIASFEPGTAGLAKGLGTGQTTISARLGTITGTATLTVKEATVMSIAVKPASSNAPKGTRAQFTATGKLSDGTDTDLTRSVTWTSSAPAVATIDVAGLADAISAGTTMIKATMGGVTGSAELIVTAATLTSLAVTPADAVVPKGTTVQLTATGTFSDASKVDVTALVSWSSAATLTASVGDVGSAKGLVKGESTGFVNITATYAGQSATVPLTVSDAKLVSLALEPPNPTLIVGTLLRVDARGTYTDGTNRISDVNVTWSTSDKNIVTIRKGTVGDGEVYGVYPGMATITATSPDNISATTQVTVKAATVTSLGITPLDPTVETYTYLDFNVMAQFDNGTMKNIDDLVTWGSSCACASVLANGETGLFDAGQATITATYQGHTATSKLTITGASAVSVGVDPSAAQIARGTEKSFYAFARLTDGRSASMPWSLVSWASSSPTIATVGNTDPMRGIATGVATGAADITATFRNMSGSAQLTVSSATVFSLSLSPTNSTVQIGVELLYTVQATFSDATMQDVTPFVTWASSNQAVATVEVRERGFARVKGVAAGMTNITAKWSGVTGTRALTVTP